MRPTRVAAAALLLAVLRPAPASAQEPEAAAECLRALRAFNEELMTSGYGIVGPHGFADSPPIDASRGGLPATPRGRMAALMDAAHILALDGSEGACWAVLAGMRDIYEERQRHAGSEPVSAEARDEWRRRRLAASIPVESLEGTIRADRLLEADLRNLHDVDLGDVEDVVLRPGGGIEYVLVSRGGFMESEEELIPVRWQDLRLTREPYRDTLVLPVQAAALERAPTVDEDAKDELASEAWRRQLDKFWSQATED